MITKKKKRKKRERKSLGKLLLTLIFNSSSGSNFDPIGLLNTSTKDLARAAHTKLEKFVANRV